MRIEDVPECAELFFYAYTRLDDLGCALKALCSKPDPHFGYSDSRWDVFYHFWQMSGMKP